MPDETESYADYRMRRAREIESRNKKMNNQSPDERDLDRELGNAPIGSGQKRQDQ
jgi:hypothetical protein